MNRYLNLRASLLLLGFVVIGCWPASAVFNQRAYEQDVSLKVDALAVMDQASMPFDSCSTDVLLLNKNLQKAYEYAKGLPDNDNTVKQWEILLDPKGDLLTAFLDEWKAKGKLSPTYIQLKKGLVAEGFDAIIGLESGKKKE